jgi:hypothetical protein
LREREVYKTGSGSWSVAYFVGNDVGHSSSTASKLVSWLDQNIYGPSTSPIKLSLLGLNKLFKIWML